MAQFTVHPFSLSTVYLPAAIMVSAGTLAVCFLKGSSRDLGHRNITVVSRLFHGVLRRPCCRLFAHIHSLLIFRSLDKPLHTIILML
jgi:hypothetical protein